MRGVVCEVLPESTFDPHADAAAARRALPNSLATIRRRSAHTAAMTPDPAARQRPDDGRHGQIQLGAGIRRRQRHRIDERRTPFQAVRRHAAAAARKRPIERSVDSSVIAR